MEHKANATVEQKLYFNFWAKYNVVKMVIYIYIYILEDMLFYCVKCYNTYCYHNVFTIVEISISYRSNKKLLSSQHFNINFYSA